MGHSHVKQNGVQLYVKNPAGRYVPVQSTENGLVVPSTGGEFDALADLQVGPCVLEYTWNQTWVAGQVTGLKFRNKATPEQGSCPFNFLVQNNGKSDVELYLLLYMNDDCSGTNLMYSGWNPYRYFGRFTPPNASGGSEGFGYSGAGSSFLQAQHFKSAQLYSSLSGQSDGERTVYIISSCEMEIIE